MFMWPVRMEKALLLPFYILRCLKQAIVSEGMFHQSVFLQSRMEVTGSRISRESFAEYITQVADAITAMTKDGYPHPTAFEIETAVAFLFFKNENCDLVLLEVGMGGNLDATNIIKNTLLAVLVSISMDHMSFLGNTLSQIAEKKAGIIKDGCHVVTAMQKPEAMRVIREICKIHNAECTVQMLLMLR